MTAPCTLLQMSGAPPDPNRFVESAVMVIDAQQDYRDRLPLAGIDTAAAVLAALLARARAAGCPVFHVVHHGAPGGLFDPEGPGAAILPEATPLAGEAVIAKTLPSAFAGTGLHERLAGTGRNRLIVAGFMTHMCVSTTVRAALDLGYRSSVVADAVATRDLPDPLTGGTIPAAEVQRSALAALADRFATVAPLERFRG